MCALSGLFALILVAAYAAPWHSPWSVDERTTLQMIEGVAGHGLPYTLNGPVDLFPELQARWNLARDGRLWGAYNPGFAYFAAPAYLLGGANAVVRLNIALLGLLCLAVYLLARSVVGDKLVAVLCAWLVLAATSIPALSLLISRYTLAITCMMWALLLTQRALSGTYRAGALVAAGLLAAAAAATHRIALPWWLFLQLSPWLIALTERGAGHLLRSRMLKQGLLFACGSVPPMLALSLVNQIRFGTWQPFSSAPCVWRACSHPLYQSHSISSMAGFLVPLLVWLVVATVCVWIAYRRNRVLAAGLVVLALLVLLSNQTLVSGAQSMGQAAAALIIDAEFADLGLAPESYWRASGPGYFYGPYVVKTALQCSPLIALALLAPLSASIRRRELVLIAGACLAMIAGVVLRGAIQVGPHTIGYPFLFIRYTTPVMPALVILAVAAIRDLPWRRWHLLAAGVLVTLLWLWLASGGNDLSPLRRMVLLRGSLLLALSAVVAVVIARREPHRGRWAKAGVCLVVLVVSFSIAVSSGLDLTAVCGVVTEKDRYVEQVGELLPQRLAIVAYTPQIDPLMTLRSSRDLVYADLNEIIDWSSVHQLIHWWFSEGRPVFLMLPSHGEIPEQLSDLWIYQRSEALAVYELRPP